MSKQGHYLVFGGELVRPDGLEFTDLGKLDIVGIFATEAEAIAAWRGPASRTVDDAHIRYFVVPLDEVLQRFVARPAAA